MRVKMVHVYSNVTIEEFVTHFFSAPFNELVAKRLDVERRDELERTDSADAIYRRMETVVPPGVVPAAVLRMMGVRRLIFTEEHWHRRHEPAIRFRTRPNVFTDRAMVEGVIRFTIREDGTLERRIDGDVTARILGIGGTIERVLLNNVERANRTIAATMEEWLEAQRNGTPTK